MVPRGLGALRAVRILRSFIVSPKIVAQLIRQLLTIDLKELQKDAIGSGCHDGG